MVLLPLALHFTTSYSINKKSMTKHWYQPGILLMNSFNPVTIYTIKTNLIGWNNAGLFALNAILRWKSVCSKLYLFETLGFYPYGWWWRCCCADAVMWCGVLCLAAATVYISSWALIQHHTHFYCRHTNTHTNTNIQTHKLTQSEWCSVSVGLMLTCVSPDTSVTSLLVSPSMSGAEDS